MGASNKLSIDQRFQVHQVKTENKMEKLLLDQYMQETSNNTFHPNTEKPK